MYLTILIYIIVTSFTIRSIFKTISVIKAVFKNEKTVMLPSMLNPDILKR